MGCRSASAITPRRRSPDASSTKYACLLETTQQPGDCPGPEKCRDFNGHVDEIIDRQGIRFVIMAARCEWCMDTNVLDFGRSQKTVNSLLNRGIHIAVLGQSPVFRFRTPYDHTNFMKSEQARRPFGRSDHLFRHDSLPPMDAYRKPLSREAGDPILVLRSIPDCVFTNRAICATS